MLIKPGSRSQQRSGRWTVEAAAKGGAEKKRARTFSIIIFSTLASRSDASFFIAAISSFDAISYLP